MRRFFLALGAIAGGSTVVLAALRAHVLPGRLDPASLAMVESALFMLGMHALALIGLAALADRLPTRPLLVSGGAFIAGMVLFVGAVLLRAIAGVAPGPVAPAGGVLLIGGWIALLVASLPRR